MDEDTNVSLACLEVDETLENRLKAHGISRRNVKSIIHSIFSDENVLKLLGGIDESVELDIPRAAVTRSKRHTDICDDTVDSLDCDISDLLPNSIAAGDDEESLLSQVLNEGTSAPSLRIKSNNASQTTLTNDDTHAYIGINGYLSESSDMDSDSDYNFLGELDDQHEEDYRYDRTTKISKKEMKNLNLTRKSRFRTTERNRKGQPGERMVLPESGSSADVQKHTIDRFLNCTKACDKLAIMRSNHVIQIPSEKRNRDVEANFSFNDKQMADLKQQMQQHVQLLAQTFLLQRAEKTNAKCLLQEIEYFRSISPNPIASAFNARNLVLAIEISHSDSNNVSNCKEKHDSQLIAHCIAKSSVFMYKELLPESVNACKRRFARAKFSYHEDCLIAHGCHEMSSHFIAQNDLINQFILPCKSKSEINNRIKRVMQGKTKDFLSNPIFKLRKFGVLPEPSKKVEPVPEESIIKPIDMTGDLPKWLVELKRSFSAINFPNTHHKQHDINIVPNSDAAWRKSANNLGKSACGGMFVFWTKEMDKVILEEVQRSGGMTKQSLSAIGSVLPTRTYKQIEQRFVTLMEIYCGPHPPKS